MHLKLLSLIVFPCVAVALFVAHEAAAQQADIADATVVAASSADKILSFSAGATPATGVQVDMSLADYGEFTDITLLATDFTGAEQVCGVAGVLLTATIQASCGTHPTDPDGFRIQLRDVTNGDLPSISNYVRVRLTADSDATEQSISVTNTVRYFDNVGTGFGDETLSSNIFILERPPGTLDVSPQDVNFGNQFVGSQSAESPINICNLGEPDSLDVSVADITVSPSPFSPAAGGSCLSFPFSLAEGECCTYHVVFAPDDDGPFTGSVFVDSDAGSILNDTVSLSGQGVAPPQSLSIVQSPDYGVVGGPFYGAVVVHVLDTNGDLFAADSSTVVEMSLAIDPSGLAELSGTTQVTVSGGVAVFSDLSIDQVGNGFELRASDQAGELDSGDSDAFAVLPVELLQDRFENLN